MLTFERIVKSTTVNDIDIDVEENFPSISLKIVENALIIFPCSDAWFSESPDAGKKTLSSE